MPLFEFGYQKKNEDTNKTIHVVAKDIVTAAKQFADRKPDVKVTEIYHLGLVMNRPKAASAVAVATVPTWTSKSGKTKPLSKIKTRNLIGIKKTLANKYATNLGIYSAVVAELARR